MSVTGPGLSFEVEPVVGAAVPEIRLFVGFGFGLGFEGGGCVECVVDDDEVVLASGGEGMECSPYLS
jgi:hypothetical protein